MANQVNSPFERLAEALFLAGDACHEVASQLRMAPTRPGISPTRRSAPKRQRNSIIPYYVFEYHREKRELGERRSARYGELQSRDWEITHELHKGKLSDLKRQDLLSEQENLRQEMTEIEQELDQETTD